MRYSDNINNSKDHNQNFDFGFKHKQVHKRRQLG
mgnify:CR=1 FL=1